MEIIQIQIILFTIVNYNLYNFILDEIIGNDSEIILDSQLHFQEIYLLLEKSNKTEIGTFLITINHIKSNRNNENSNYENNSIYNYCDSIDYSKCGNCEDNKCSLILCGKESFNSNINYFEKLDDICIPKNITNKKKKEICLNFNEVNSFKAFNECIYEFNSTFNYISSSLYLIIILIVISTILFIIYYNKYLIEKNQKPFNVPIIFTEFFFPNNNKDEDEDYLQITEENLSSPYDRVKYYKM